MTKQEEIDYLKAHLRRVRTYALSKRIPGTTGQAQEFIQAVFEMVPIV